MVKERGDQQKSNITVDNDGYKKRAACVCVKNENENEVLLISSSRNNDHWIIPGGGIEYNENPEDAAQREVYEEAGVKGRLGRLLGIFEVYENKERKHRTSVYLMIVEKEYDEWEENKVFGRRRKWFNIEDAKYELDKHKPIQGSYLNMLKGYEKCIWHSSEDTSTSTTTTNRNYLIPTLTAISSSVLNLEITTSNNKI